MNTVARIQQYTAQPTDVSFSITQKQMANCSAGQVLYSTISIYTMTLSMKFTKVSSSLMTGTIKFRVGTQG